MTSSCAKRLKLERLPTVGLSDCALSRLLQHLQEQGCLSQGCSVSRRSIGRARQQDILMDGDYGELFKEIRFDTNDASGYVWPSICPFAQLSLFTWRSSALRSLFKTAIAREGLSTTQCPWKIIWYTDETLPGNILALDAQRKVWCVYYTFKELGQHAWHNADLWFLQGVLRTSQVKKVPDGFANIFSKCMQAFNLMATDGVRIWLGPEESILLFAKVGAMLGDERGIKESWAFKGSSGSKPCYECCNVIQQRRHGVRRPVDTWCVDIGCSDSSKFRSTDDAFWFQVADRLQRMHSDGTPKTERQELERMLGLNLAPTSILFDPVLRLRAPPSIICWDWVHVWLVSGISQNEIHLFLLRANGVLEWSHIQTYFQAWECPAAHTDIGTLRRLWGARREASCGSSFKCSASEMLDMYPIFRSFLNHVLAPQDLLTAEINSMNHMMACLDVLVRVLWGDRRPETARELGLKTSMYLNTFKETYDHNDLKPKHHYAMHLPQQMLNHEGFLFGTFTLERKHQVAKRIGSTIAIARTYERSLSIRLVNVQLSYLLEAANLDDSVNTLFAPKHVQFGDEECYFAMSGRLSSKVVNAGAFVWLSDGKLARIQGVAMALDQSWTVVLIEIWQQIASNVVQFAPSKVLEWVKPQVLKSIPAFHLLHNGHARIA